MFNLNKFKDIHKGEACYIFGDGPSIKWFDLAEFADKIGISCGSIPFHNDFKSLSVKYHLLVEPWFYCPSWIQRHQYLKDFKPLVKIHKETMKEYKDKEFFINLSNFPWILGLNITYVHRTLIPRNSKLHKVKEVKDPFGGSFHATLSLAYLMGFSKVYLVGFDAWTIKPLRTRRWYELGKGEIFKVDDNDIELDFLNILKENMDIYTILPHEKNFSSNVKGLSYSEFTGKNALYKENHQLTSKDHLKIMNSLNGRGNNEKKYNIF